LSVGAGFIPARKGQPATSSAESNGRTNRSTQVLT